jgi:hypothetical protein
MFYPLAQCRFSITQVRNSYHRMLHPCSASGYVFRTQKTEREIDVREALAGAQQPLILDYAMRRARWINLWSPSDWIYQVGHRAATRACSWAVFNLSFAVLRSLSSFA